MSARGLRAAWAALHLTQRAARVVQRYHRAGLLLGFSAKREALHTYTYTYI